MKNLLRTLRENNILLEVADGELKVYTSGPVPEPSLVAEIRLRKAELIRFLSAGDQAGFRDTFQVNIPAVPPAENYPLSSSQRRLWVLSQFDGGSIAYNVQGVYVFEGNLDTEGLAYAFNSLVQRHESLRTVFRQDEKGEVRQYIRTAEEINFNITIRDLRQEENSQELMRELVTQEFTRPFDLENGPLLRVLVCRDEDQKWVFSYVMHHIISDGWSMQILIKELLLFYNARTIGEPNPLQPLRIHYKDYASWQQEQLSGESLREHRGYWLKQFDGELPLLDLAGDRPRPAAKTYRGDVVNKIIDSRIAGVVKELSQEKGGTLFMGLLAAVNALLHRYTGQEDIVIGTSIASREHTDLENQIGFYVNTLALRTRFSGNDSYKELLDNVKEVTVGAYGHQVYPFDELVDLLKLGRDMSRSPLFDVMVVLQQNKIADADRPEGMAHIIVSPFEGGEQAISKFDLTFFFVEMGEALQVNIAYNSDIYDRDTIERLAAHLEQLMDAIAASPSQSINTLDYLPVFEKHSLAVQLSTSSVSLPLDATVVSLFEEQVRQTPDSTAVVSNGRSLTYRQLDDSANRLAHSLRKEHGVQPGDLVGIILDRSENMIVSLMAVMKSGGAYVAIDPENPKARKEFIIRDTAIRALITQTDYLFDLEFYEGGIFAIDIQLDGLEAPAEALVPVTRPQDLAYVIYTSGSTGQPKGVMVAHAALVDYAYGILEKTNIRDCKSFGLVSTIAADLGNTVIYTSLLMGGELHVFPAADVTNAAKMQQADVDCLKIVPSHWKALQDGQKLFVPNKCLVFGGEQLTRDVVSMLRKGQASCSVFNHYGPSETTIGKLTRRIDINDPAAVISLGSPFGNTVVYVLDAQGGLLPHGVPGEICIGGAGLSLGYWNNPELTAQKFVPDPYRSGQLIYRTGDVGRWLPDGTIEFIGRKDDQVKIRGYRIELGEIESVLKAYPHVQAAAVLARAAGGEKELVAYVVPKSSFNKTEAQAYLSGLLPSHMMPAHFVELEALPLTANGKIDRKSLPDPSGLGSGAAYVAPRTATEEKLVQLWQEVLVRDSIGVKDNFFDVGGHSLRATRLSSLIHKEFDVNLGLKELFDTVILEDQARLIDEAVKTSFYNIEPTAVQEDYVLSSSQRRLWVLSQFEEGNAAYNVPGVYVFEGDLDREALERSFHTLVERHEILRTVFRENANKEVRQYIRKPEETGFRISSRDVRGEREKDAKVQEIVRAEFARPFNLSDGPLVRISLLQVEDRRWVLVYVLHHIISDGWSKSILINELLALYNAYAKGEPSPLAPLRLQYKDYAAWQQEHLSGEVLQRHRNFWVDHFEGELPVLDLPGDKLRPAIKTYSGQSFTRVINPKLGTGIKSICRQQGATLFMGMLAAVEALFCRYTGQYDMIIGTPVAGREHIDLQDQIGFYTNTLALRTRFSATDSYRKLLDNVREVTLGAYQHQLYPFDTLVNELNIRRDMSRNPLFDIQVIVENAGAAAGEDAGLQKVSVSGYAGAETSASVFDMVLFFVDSAEGLKTNIVYNSDVFSRRSVEQVAAHLEQMLAAIVAHPDEAITRLEFMSAEDKTRLLDEFNASDLQLQKEKNIIDLFSGQVNKTPNALAVFHAGQQLSYQELDEQSDRLAYSLVNNYNLKKGELVAVILDRTEKWTVAMLAVMKSGGVYVPIDPEYPMARKEFMLKDAAARLLITQSGFIFDLDYYTGDVFAVDVQMDALDAPAQPLQASLEADDLAYVIYTSGSTGQPKGVMISHGALSASIQSQRPIFGIEEGMRCLQFTSSSFDVSVFETFIALASGGSLFVSEEDHKKDPRLLENYITANGVEVASMPPAYLRLLEVDKLSTLRKLITGGEAAVFEAVMAFIKSGGTYYNAYGPTESSLCTSVFPLQGDAQVEGSIPIGKPISFVDVFILDENGLVPVGVTGELCIGGAGLAKGYLNREELTAERFVPNPFRQGEKMYRTGDLARWMPDGNLEFLGRKDDQVKVNGYRIELGEVEKAVQNHPLVDSAVVIARSNRNGGKDLAAYIVSSQEVSASDLLPHLSKNLPAYMIPAHFVQMQAFPLTGNGKVDRSKLPDPDGIEMASGEEYVAPRNENERIMVRIWEELLGKEKISIRSSFFDLGGDSIKILRMTTEMKKELGLDIPIADIYKNNTIESMMAHASSNRGAIEERNRKVREKKMQVKEEIEELKQRILSSPGTPDRENIEDIYPMSDIEKGMIYESLLNERLHVYHDQMVQHKVFPRFSIDRFRLAVRLMAEKHPILRTSFNLEDYGTEVQIVHRQIGDVVRYRDLTGMPRAEQESEVRSFMKAELDQPFRFTQAPLWRMDVFNFGSDEIIFVFQTHHAIIDGWSDASYTTELHNLYLKLVADASYRPEPLKSSYKDFIIQHEIDKKVEEVKDFWKQELEGCSRVDLLTEEEDFQMYSGMLSGAQVKKLEKLAAGLNTTIKAVSLSAYLYMLKVLNYEDEVVAGLVTNNRPNCEDGDKILGCFLNTIPFRVVADSNETCAALVSRVHRKLVELKNYEGLSVLEIASIHNKQMSAGNPFFDMIFNYLDYHTYQSMEADPAAAESTAAAAVNITNYGRTNTHFDFSINVTGGNYAMGLRLTKKLRCGFSAEKVGRLYFRILEYFIGSAQQELGGMDFVGGDEKRRLLHEFNNTKLEFGEDATLVDLFQEQVLKTPEATALVTAGGSYTYRQLNESANQFASYLGQNYQVRTDERVGVLLERNEWMVIALLGVLKSGAAYVPMDTEYPQERIDYLVSTSQCRVVIDEKELHKFLALQDSYSGKNPAQLPRPGDLSYVIYTSGSTGQPKGVMIEHRNAHAFIQWCRREFDETRYDLVLAVTSICFDLSIFEIFYPLSIGKKIRVLPSALSIPGYLNTGEKLLLNTVPSVVGALLAAKADLGSVTILNMAGEPIPRKYVSQLDCERMEVRNLYGPSEYTTYTTNYRIRGEASILIGQPIANTQVYIVSENMHLQPIGVAGEIVIGGAGLARGYLNDAALTASKFISNPFNEGERAYKTGDLGRWLPDGNIDFIGRKDDQVKVRGYRIELGEIEWALQGYAGMESTVVVAHKNREGEKELVAYTVSAQPLNTHDLRTFLSKRLPAYMIPAHYVQLQALPLTPNGKVDRRRLPNPVALDMETGVEYVEPRNETEEMLVEIWKEILDREKIGVKDNFFELGGHSLKAMKLLAKIHRKFDVKLKLEEMFTRTTIEDMGREIIRETWARKEHTYSNDLSDQNFIL